jgi:threonine dehydratase
VLELEEPTIADVLSARRAIEPYIHRTPLRHYPLLSDLIGGEVWVKHENMQILGSFKVRGGLNLVSRVPEAERRCGFVTASTGNHGQSVAFAARTFGASARIVVPVGANPVKVRAMESLGATVIRHGDVFEQSREHAERLAGEEGYRYVHPANEKHLIAGVATYSLEVHEDLSGIDYLIVPVGAGSGASGACIVSAAVAPATRVLAVQAAAAPAAYASWKSGSLLDAPMKTAAEGLATGSAYELPQRILRRMLHDFITVSEERITEAIVRYISDTRTLVEHAGAAALAAAIEIREKLAGKRVVLIASGANLSVEQLTGIIASRT